MTSENDHLQLRRQRGEHIEHALADIDRLESLATGETRSTFADCTDPATGFVSPETALTLAEAQALLAPSKIDLASLTPEFFSQLRQVLLQALQRRRLETR
jgi:hypothetical protein